MAQAVHTVPDAQALQPAVQLLQTVPFFQVPKGQVATVPGAAHKGGCMGMRGCEITGTRASHRQQHVFHCASLPASATLAKLLAFTHRKKSPTTGSSMRRPCRWCQSCRRCSSWGSCCTTPETHPSSMSHKGRRPLKGCVGGVAGCGSKKGVGATAQHKPLQGATRAPKGLQGHCAGALTARRAKLRDARS